MTLNKLSDFVGELAYHISIMLKEKSYRVFEGICEKAACTTFGVGETK